MNGYELSRKWFDWCFENPDRINPTHTAMYFFIIEHCNRLGWKEKFGLPTSMVKDAIGIRNFRTYKNTLTDLVDFGFIKMIEISKNQYSSNIIAIADFTTAPTEAPAKALDKALQKHSQKQGKSIDSIIKQETNNKEPINKEPDQIEVYISEFNKIKNSKYKGLDKRAERVFKETIKKYSIDEMIRALKNAMKNQFHIERNFVSLTPEFFTRIDKIEMYLNFGEVKPQGKQA